MPKQRNVSDVVDDIHESILATPKHQRRLRSKTFWANFGYAKRTADRIERVQQELKQRGIAVNLGDAELGSEGKEEWIVLTVFEPGPPPPGTVGPDSSKDVPTPDERWFRTIETRIFESEREVEYYFIVPLLERLGYEEDDLAIGFPVQMYEGVKKVNKEADFVVFNGSNGTAGTDLPFSRSKADALLVVEAKKTGKILTEDAVSQARSYAMWLTTPYFLVTNGEEVRVYNFRGAVQPDVLLMNFNRVDLRDRWPLLYQTLNKADVIRYKANLLKVLQGARPG